MAIQIDRIELADLGNPKVLAIAVLKQLGEPVYPTPIEEIAFGCGITSIEQLQTKGFEGALLTTATKAEGIILVNQNNPPKRRRYTIGHELGHFLNPWHVPPDGGFMCTQQHMFHSQPQKTQDRMGMEAEANAFAAEILMPANLFKARLRHTGADPSTEAIVLVSDDFDVSILAAARRLVDLRKDCTVVLSQNGTIEQVYRGSEFPFITLKCGQPVPSNSITKKQQGTSGTHSEICEVECHLWTNASVRRGAQFQEQVLIQGKGYRVTLLVLDESECDDAEEEDELNESWTPRFRR